ncbi:diguanylate cyclase [Aestuariibacter halophilus]|uniref:diguanylate cyclase n=1 Tax=Fluctibacter halophilus TaxID=226011 RepID=A0ABS8G841_9ALTE|nr:GGDEF domain-containing protein [Aestuariibacter halophilus]MCC2616331.1 diguanylate cyclase [Aestuariibacter halophilus]
MRWLLLWLVSASLFAQSGPGSVTFDAVKAQAEQFDGLEQKLEVYRANADAVAQWPVHDQGKYYFEVGFLAGEMQDYPVSDSALNNAISLLESIDVTATLVHAYIERSYFTYVKTNDIEQYCPDRATALAYARELNDPETLVKALTQRAFCLNRADNFQQGLALLDEAITIAQREQLSEQRSAMIYNATANIYRKVQVHLQAYDYLQRALDEWSKVDDRSDMFNMRHNLVGEAIALGWFDKAQTHVDALYALAERSPDHEDFTFFAHFNAGRLALAQQDYAVAVRVLENALTLANTTNEKYFVNFANILLAEAFARQGDLHLAGLQVKQFSSLDSQLQTSTLKAQAIAAAAEGDVQQTLQHMFALYDLSQRQLSAFVENETLLRVAEHDTRVAGFEKQILEQKLAISELELARQKDQQFISQLTVATVALLLLVAFAVIVWLNKTRQRLKHKAQTDELTGIANRRHMIEQGEKLLNHAIVNGQPLSVLLFDLDDFKSINDRYGHLSGDKVLKAVASRVHYALRADDLFGRIGGEEFLVILPATPHSAACDIAERITTAVSDGKIHTDEQDLSVTISTGLCSLTGREESLTTLMKRADDALYQAKSTGKNRVVRWDADTSPVTGGTP